MQFICICLKKCTKFYIRDHLQDGKKSLSLGTIKRNTKTYYAVYDTFKMLRFHIYIYHCTRKIVLHKNPLIVPASIMPHAVTLSLVIYLIIKSR